MTTPLTVNLHLNPDDFQTGALELLRLVRPNWTDEVLLKVFSNGITNKMLGYHRNGDESDMVLIRINGNKTEIFLDRENEIKSFMKLHAAGCAPKLYCIFNNGLCYEYIPGTTITRDEVRRPEMFSLITKQMVKLHKIGHSDTIAKRPNCFSLCKQFLDLGFSPRAPPGRRLDGFSSVEETKLRAELATMEEHLPLLSSPLVYCHNDLLLNNIIFNKSKGTIHFIDYEYTGVNYQAFDIGNHFCEFAGVDELDYSFYPDRDLQLAWLTEYLQHWKTGSSVTSDDVEKLYIQVNKCALMSHLLWATWALVQAKYSHIDFDYIKYAKDRIAEYYKRREEFLSL